MNLVLPLFTANASKVEFIESCQYSFDSNELNLGWTKDLNCYFQDDNLSRNMKFR